jgi:hypothetical protein
MVVEARDAEHGQEIRENLAARGFIHIDVPAGPRR